MTTARVTYTEREAVEMIRTYAKYRAAASEAKQGKNILDTKVGGAA